MTFAIAGVSGNTGRVAAETLLAQGKKVRVIVRDAAKGEPWRSKGAEVAVADLGDQTALAAALAGAEGAYLLVPPNMGAPDFRGYQERTVASIRWALERSGVPHVVFLSSVGAQHLAGTGPIAGLHLAEEAFGSLEKTVFSFVRAAYFMENLGGSLGMLGQGLLPSFTPADLGIDMIATADIGRLAAGLLVEGARETRIIELGGPARSMNDVAAVLSRLMGKPVKVHEAPVEAVVPTFTGFGMSQQMAELYREMIEGIIKGHVAFEGGHRRVAGTTGLETVLGAMLAAPATAH